MLDTKELGVDTISQEFSALKTQQPASHPR